MIYILSRSFAIVPSRFDDVVYDFLIPDLGLVFLCASSAIIYLLWTRAPRSVSFIPKWMDWLAYLFIVPLTFLLGFDNVILYYQGSLPTAVSVSCLLVFITHMIAHLLPMLALEKIYSRVNAWWSQ